MGHMRQRKQGQRRMSLRLRMPVRSSLRSSWNRRSRAIEHIVAKVPGGLHVCLAIVNVHAKINDIAHNIVSKLAERYGEATAGAIIGSGHFIAGHIFGALKRLIGAGVPGTRAVGALPALAVAEAG